MADVCGWCSGPIRRGARRDSKYCRVECRQAAHRAKVTRVRLERDATPLRLAYADPPYPGKAEIYRDHPDYGGEVDHAELLSRLAGYDGWALSTSAEALPAIAALCVAQDLDVRIGAWVRGAVPHGQARILNAWEPVIYVPARRNARAATDAPIEDVQIGPTPRGRPTLPTSVKGMKPPAFCVWLFGLLGASPGDELDDLFPGSGIVTRSWRLWSGANEPPSLGLVPDFAEVG